jgi:hypothetical protein
VKEKAEQAYDYDKDEAESLASTKVTDNWNQDKSQSPETGRKISEYMKS